jgi:hypothetical protein
LSRIGGIYAIVIVIDDTVIIRIAFTVVAYAVSVSVGLARIVAIQTIVITIGNTIPIRVRIRYTTAANTAGGLV